MGNPQSQSASAPLLSPCGFWLWAIVTVGSFLLCYFIIETVLWDIGWYTFAPLYPMPADDPHLIKFVDQVNFLQGQALVASIPSLIFALGLVGFAVWRRKLAYTAGPLLGLLLGGFREYDILWESHFGGHALGPGLQFAVHAVQASLTSVLARLPRLPG